MNLQLYTHKPASLFDEFANSLNHFWDSPLRNREKSALPACDFHETDDYYFFSFDVPGVKKKDIHLEIQDGILHISGEKRNEYGKEKQKDGKQFQEKFYGQFQRSFTLPSAVREEAIETHFKDGVLELLIPKAKVSKGRKIEVESAQKEGLFSRLSKKTISKKAS